MSFNTTTKDNKRGEELDINPIHQLQHPKVIYSSKKLIGWRQK